MDLRIIQREAQLVGHMTHLKQHKYDRHHQQNNAGHRVRELCHQRSGEGHHLIGVHALQHALGMDNLVNDEEDIATVAGLVIAINGQIPKPGEVLQLAPLTITVVEANDYRVDLVRVVKEQPVQDDEEE